MDRRASLWANHMLGNDVGAPLLEVTLGGARLRFEAPALVALTGADCGAGLDGRPLTPWRSYRVEPGQTLDFGYATAGMRAYLAFAGGLTAPTIFGSASVVLREKLSGPMGRPLKNGDSIGWGDSGSGRMVRHVPARHARTTVGTFEDGALLLPLHTGYEWEHFSEADRDALFAERWIITPSSDRVVTRLTGGALTSGPSVLDSVPLVDGTVQIPGDGAPLVFMRDRPTIGGYPKVGSVDPVSLDALAQARPGTPVRFVQGDRRESLEALRQRVNFFGPDRQ